jgi:hypothetical protein
LTAIQQSVLSTGWYAQGRESEKDLDRIRKPGRNRADVALRHLSAWKIGRRASHNVGKGKDKREGGSKGGREGGGEKTSRRSYIQCKALSPPFPAPCHPAAHLDLCLASSVEEIAGRSLRTSRTGIDFSSTCCAPSCSFPGAIAVTSVPFSIQPKEPMGAG